MENFNFYVPTDLFMVAVVSNVMACTNKLLIWPKKTGIH